MTLSRFLRDYVYIPLGGNQKGSLRRYSNLVITMLVGGIWHGAAWSYLVWGGLHGLFLVVNHVWNKYARIKLYGLGWILTFMVVMHAWVLFKAGEFFPMDFETALTMFRAMYDSIPSATELYGRGNLHDCLLIGITMSIAFFAPNTLQLLAKYRPVLEKIPRINGATETHHLSQFFLWRPTRLWAFVTGLLFVFYLHIASRPDTYVEFIYFQF